MVSPSRAWYSFKQAVFASAGRFPLVIASTSLLAFIGLIITQFKLPEASKAVLGQLAMTAALGVPLFFGLTIFRERNSYSPLIELLGLPPLLAYFLMVKEPLFNEPYFYGIQWALLFAGLHLCCAAIGFCFGAETRGFWQFNRQMFSRFIIASVYSGVLLAGMEMAIMSAVKLFDLNLKDHIYADAAVIIFGFFHPLFFISGLPADWTALDSDSEYPHLMKVFTQIVLAPLVAVFTIILYGYSLRILITKQWPHGWVALPILLLSGFGILAVLLLHPLKDKLQERWARWFTRCFPRALAPLSLLLLLSVKVRISEYGWTEPRYLGVAASLWLLLWSTVFTFKPASGIRWVPVSLALVAFATVLGPFNATSICRQSQHARFCRMLENCGVLGYVTARPASEIKLENAQYNDLHATLKYLLQTHGTKSVSSILKPIWKDEWKQSRKGSYSISQEILASLWIKRMPQNKGYVSWRLDSSKTLTQSGFTQTSIFGQIRRDFTKKATDGAVWLMIEDGALKLGYAQEGPFTAIPLRSMFDALPVESHYNLSPELLTVDWTHEGKFFRVVFTELGGTQSIKEEVSIDYCKVVLFTR